MPRKKIAVLMLMSILMLISAVFSPEVLAEDTDRVYYGTDPTAFETQTYTRDRNYYQTPVLYPGDSLVFQTDSQPINGLRYMGYSSIGPLWDELDPENTVFEIHEDVGGNQKYLYSKITLSPEADHILVLTVGSVGGARLKEAECQGWAAVGLSAEAAPLYLDLTYDYDGGKIFGVPNPSRVLNPEYESWLILNSRPFREGFHLSFMEIGYPYDYQQYERPSEDHPAGAVKIRYAYPGGSSALTVTAGWSTGKTLTFHTNGGTLDGYEDPILEFENKSEIDIPGAVPIKEGKTFLGWFADEVLTEPVESYRDIVLGSDRYDYHVYAAWDEEDTRFQDVRDETKFYYEAVYWAVGRGITGGYTDSHGNPTGYFGPDDDCTRAQIVTFLYRAAGSPAVDTANAPKFKDVKKTDYFYKPVIWASQRGITTGYTDKNGKPTGYFGSNDKCTRGQVVTFLYRGGGSPAIDTSNLPKFKDVKKSDYFYKAVVWAYQNNITTGYSKTKFAPDDICTRGQVVTFLYRAD